MQNYLTKNVEIIIYGLGVSGIASAKYIANHYPNKIILSDDNISSIENAKKQLAAIKEKITFKNANNIEFSHNSLIICAPGIPINIPPHPILQKALKLGANIICDIELFFDINKHQNFTAITGTNGKSTCTTLVHHILQKLDLNCEIGGNIGVAAFNMRHNKKDIINYILELSSYQIDLLKKTSIGVAAITNITQDHIERYGNVENYANSKVQIFNNQNHGDFAIFNIDNKLCNEFYQKFLKKNVTQNLVAISTTHLLKDGISLIDNQIIVNYRNIKLSFKINPQYLIGAHNIENILTSFAIIFCHYLRNYSNIDFSTKIDEISHAINDFKGLKHRLEYVGNINNIKFYNDSKATNAQSTINALKALNNISWIVGGQDKTDGIEPLLPYFNKVKKAYLIGDSSDRFARFFKKNNVKYELCNILETATKKAFKDAKNNKISQETILLSPACASFDQWQNFEHRGNAFYNIFNELSNN